MPKGQIGFVRAVHVQTTGANMVSMINRYGAERLHAAALLLANDAGLDEDPASLIWAVTKEAARTLSHMPGLPRRGYPGKSAWPDFRDDDFFAVIRERLSDGVDGEVLRTRMVPSSAAITRCEIMWDLWRSDGFPKHGARRELLRVVWAYAGGLRPAVVKTVFGVSRTRLHRAKQCGCESIAEKMCWNKRNKSGKVFAYDGKMCA